VARGLKKRGFRVIGMSHGRDETLHDESVDNWVWSPVSLEALMQISDPISQVFHCAGSGSVGRSLVEPGEDFKSNVNTLQAVVEYIRKVGDVSLVFPSSASVYGNTALSSISEETPLKPVSPYGYNKLIGEVLIRQYCQHFNVKAVAIRLFSVYGAGLKKQLLWDACNKLSQGATDFHGTGLESRDWIHVDDAAELMIAAADHASTNFPVVNGGTGQAVSVAEVLGILASGIAPRARVSFNGIVRAGDPLHLRADPRNALALGWSPTISLPYGLARYAAWFKSQASLGPENLHA